jgi:hypothetical protein
MKLSENYSKINTIYVPSQFGHFRQKVLSLFIDFSETQNQTYKTNMIQMS